MPLENSVLNEVLLCRTNNDIYLLKSAYKALYKKDLVSTIKSELSMKTERMFVMALLANRDESPMVNQQAVQHDLQQVHAAARGMGTDEIKICEVLLNRSFAHLQALSSAYLQTHRRTLSSVIASEMSGHMKDGLVRLSYSLSHPSSSPHPSFRPLADISSFSCFGAE